MSEPRLQATKVVEVVPPVLRWWVDDDRIGGSESDAFAIVDQGALTLIDPLPVDLDQLTRFGKPEAIVLTAGNHQRAAWRLRNEFRIPVFAPVNAFGLEQEPDSWFEGGDTLPGGLLAFHTPGPVASMHSLWLVKPVKVAFVSDLLTHDGSGALEFVPQQYQDDPARTRASVRRILEAFEPQILCFNHGPPLTEGVKEALEKTLRDDTEELQAQP